MKPSEIADALNGGVLDGHRLEKQLYYSIATRCLSDLGARDSRSRMVLFCAGQLALALACELEADAITADADALWNGYAVALEALIRLAEDQRLSAQELVWRLSGHIAAIYPPKGAPD